MSTQIASVVHYGKCQLIGLDWIGCCLFSFLFIYSCTFLQPVWDSARRWQIIVFLLSIVFVLINPISKLSLDFTKTFKVQISG